MDSIMDRLAWWQNVPDPLRLDIGTYWHNRCMGMSDIGFDTRLLLLLCMPGQNGQNRHFSFFDAKC